MTYKAYIDNIQKKTGKTPEDFRRMAEQKGLMNHAELLAWLKNGCGLGHGYANAIILHIRNPALAKEKLRKGAKVEAKA